jgi:hypothetical protein
MIDMNFLVTIGAFLVIVALCIFVYNLLLAPLIGRPASMMPIMDLLVLLIIIGIVLFALNASGLWERIVGPRV